MSEAELLQKYEPFIRGIVKKHRIAGDLRCKEDYEDRMQVARMSFILFIRKYGEEKALMCGTYITRRLNEYIRTHNLIHFQHNQFFKLSKKYIQAPIEDAESTESNIGIPQQTESKLMLEGCLNLFNEEEKKIAKLLMAGYKPSQIGRILGYENKFKMYKKLEGMSKKAKSYYGSETA